MELPGTSQVVPPHALTQRVDLGRQAVGIEQQEQLMKGSGNLAGTSAVGGMPRFLASRAAGRVVLLGARGRDARDERHLSMPRGCASISPDSGD